MTETTSVVVDCEEEGRGDGLRLRGVARLALTRGLFLGRRVTMSLTVLAVRVQVADECRLHVKLPKVCVSVTLGG
jgi:hypothetical protein